MTSIESILSLCRRRGFVFPSSEIYGGLASAWDYGPLGADLKRNIQNFWWRSMTQLRSDVVGLDASILMHPRVWEASGHVKNFSDLMTEDTVTNERFRWDQLTDSQRETKTSPSGNPLSDPRDFNLMFRTHIGSVTDQATEIYLRPETAQGIYVNFNNVIKSSRMAIPFGIAQVGKAFRNEVVTKHFIFRTCEFEQLEMQYFVHPNDADGYFSQWRDARMRYYSEIGITPENLRLHPHGDDELAHYAKEAVDIQYHFPFGWQELEGIHNRGDYDLTQHMSFSGKDLQYRQPDGEMYTPYIIETSAGLTRTVLMVLCDAYEEQNLEGDIRTVLHLHPALAPIKLAVLPLVKKDGLAERARQIDERLRANVHTYYDQSGAIGRRYRRQDEIGTPLCLTVDYETMEKNTVTIRERDSMQQTRIPLEGIERYITDATGYAPTRGT